MWSLSCCSRFYCCERKLLSHQLRCSLSLCVRSVNIVSLINIFLFNYSIQKKLHALTIESDRLKGETNSRAELLGKIDDETKTVEGERAKAEHINRKYRQQLSDYKV